VQPEQPAHKRYLSDASTRAADYIQAAKDYVSGMDEGEQLWLYSKPYDRAPGNFGYFQEQYTAMNLIRAMDVMPGGRILEVGSGPGWISEILMLLGFEVDAIEPSEKMIEVAEARLSGARSHYRATNPPRVSFHCCTLEEADFEEGTFDGVLFYDALHHVVDEQKGINSFFRFLRQGGVIGISEWAWIPGDEEQEATLEDEMKRFGTLENPLTREYLDDLLEQAGFVGVTRYHSINGFIALDQEGCGVASLAQHPAPRTNNLTARKPSSVAGPTTQDYRAVTRARVVILEESWNDEDGEVSLTVRLENLGETTWLQRQTRCGWVAIALRSGVPGSEGYLEAAQRHQIPEPVPPKGNVTVHLAYEVPAGTRARTWHVDLVNEGLFWFSECGTEPAEVGLLQT
jgi:2-polyprenyl-3-methyl-5-hydroxy-6-metoxy-1,4-benzoquinol methylase